MEKEIDDILAINEAELSIAEEISHEDDDQEMREDKYWEEEEEIESILVCEECNNQWEDMVSESNRENLFCPMCGTSRVVLI
ncbi:MAG: hypothetical protein WDA74_02045 [Spirochaetota bacterium]